ncbi:ribonuclease P protein component [Coraliomargarita sinensis]|uniref:Ribonuclease P protein component n=1 Tax=Coraliomargarita sinensis TaxID=2174842 RepID=A0A317ZH59_9BACT|nr:ribonuclease P protein component [Coraliomargarita sinensis]PXA03139.1 ribonuclease P protein component [Coraliomargarita sinensis]
MGIPASQRLRKQSDFQQVRRSEHRIHCGPFVVQCQPGGEASASRPMLGVIASRRVGNAVKRNRGKRLVREIFRRSAGTLPPGSRYVVVLRSGFDRYSFAELEAHFARACAKIVRRTEAGEASK